MDTQISADTLKKTISYFYLLSFCPPKRLKDFSQASGPLRKHLAKEAGMAQSKFIPEVTPQVSWRIVAFSQSSREPDEELVGKLAEAAESAAKSQKALSAFQSIMLEIAALPGRAKAENRLHRKKGCRFCVTPCRYGYFSLVSDPQFDILQYILETETKKPQGEQNPITPVWSYALSHLMRVMGSEKIFITADHLGNLAYCLLMLSMAKSRYPLPEAQITAFQEANQQTIRTWPSR